jgi:hypothetical protein
MGYRIYRSIDTGDSYQIVNRHEPGRSLSLVTNVTYTDSGLENGFRYYYTVTALDSDSIESEYSNFVQVIPGELDPLPEFSGDATYDFAIAGGDIEFDTAGRAHILVTEDKLGQELQKVVLTALGSNKYHPRYGSHINEKLVGRPMSPHFTKSTAEGYIKQALTYYQGLQQAQKAEQRLDPAEELYKIHSIEVIIPVADKRVMVAYVNVLTAEFRNVEIAVPMRFI